MRRYGYGYPERRGGFPFWLVALGIIGVIFAPTFLSPPKLTVNAVGLGEAASGNLKAREDALGAQLGAVKGNVLGGLSGFFTRAQAGVKGLGGAALPIGAVGAPEIPQAAPLTPAPIQLVTGSVSPKQSVRLLTDPTITEEGIERVLASYGSPATGTAKLWIKGWEKYGINPAIPLGFFIVESTAATNPNWAGWITYPTEHTYDIGNIICVGSSPYWDGTCHGRFRDYNNWEEGILDWYHLIATEYIEGRGHVTVADVILTYAPAFENDVNGYVNGVDALVAKWATGDYER